VRKYQKTIEGAFADIDRSERINTNYRMKALVVSGNRQTIDIFAYLFREVGIEAANCDSKSRAIDRVTSEKFDALVLDFDNLSGCSEIVENVRGIRPNREIPLFAIASESQAKATALALSSNFVIERPLVPQQIKSLLRTVYGRMLRSSQAYFRLNIELSVSMARASGPLLNGRTLNVSQNGMALTSPVSLKTGEMLHLVFAIPHTDVVVSAEGTVIWDDGHGKSGIRFKSSSASAEARYFEWLHDHFFMRPNAQYLDTEIQRNPAYASCE
jgi:DNA-binding response OmpR family regulator